MGNISCHIVSDTSLFICKIRVSTMSVACPHNIMPNLGIIVEKNNRFLGNVVTREKRGRIVIKYSTMQESVWLRSVSGGKVRLSNIYFL